MVHINSQPRYEAFCNLKIAILDQVVFHRRTCDLKNINFLISQPKHVFRTDVLLVLIGIQTVCKVISIQQKKFVCKTLGFGGSKFWQFLCVDHSPDFLFLKKNL